MKKLILISLLLVIICSGCSADYFGSDTASHNTKIVADFERIEGYENLYFCKETKIVYWIGGNYNINVIGDDYTTSYMTVYYAPNGFPYKWNISQKRLEEIE
jgi:hypothetical protein